MLLHPRGVCVRWPPGRAGACALAVALLLLALPGAAPAQDGLELVIEPRLGYREATLSFYSESGTAFRQGEFVKGRLDWMLNLSVAGSGFQEQGGLYLGMGLARLDFDRQESIAAGEGSVDVGTSTHGFFTYAAPSYLLRWPGGMELGGGLGLAWVHASGTVGLYSGTSATPEEYRRFRLNRLAPTIYAHVRFGYFLARTGIALFRYGPYDVEASDTLIALGVEIPLGGTGAGAPLAEPPPPAAPSPASEPPPPAPPPPAVPPSPTPPAVPGAGA
jgi:hypothetical protein